MNHRIIKEWIGKNEPQGVAKLAAKAEVSVGTIFKILKDGHEPGLDIVRKIAKAMDVTLAELISPEEDVPPAA